MRIFVTGGAGFIGIHLCKKLALLHEVTVYDNFSNSNKENFPTIEHVTLIVGDILDNSKLFNSMKNHDLVIHLAAKTDVINSVNNPDDTFETNVKGTQNILDSCNFNNISKIIAISSAAIYKNSVNSVDEASTAKPLSPYGQSKLDMENIIIKSKINYNILRLFNVYGNRQNRGVIVNFVKNISENKPLIVFGDGKSIRDFIHIDDVAKSIKMLIEKKIEKPINLSSGKKTNLIKACNILNKKFVQKKSVFFDLKRGKDIFGDNTFLKKLGAKRFKNVNQSLLSYKE